MITEEKVRELAEERIEGTDNFIVEIAIRPGNDILVLLDSDSSTSISDCMSVSRNIEHNLDREIEDFSLSVSSPGIDSPLKVTRQYVKNVGREVKVRFKESGSIQGEMVEANDDGIKLKTRVKERIEGRKAKEWVETIHELSFADIEETKVVIKFK